MAKKAIFKMAAAAIHLEFLKISIFGQVTTAFAICTKFHENRTISH